MARPASPRGTGGSEQADDPADSAARNKALAVTPSAPTSRREFWSRGGISLSAIAGLAGASAESRDGQPPYQNVLLILVDDLRPELGCYGSSRVLTPQIDRLAASGLTFLKSYCQQAASSPSRTSLLTGLRPDTTRVYDQQTHFRRARPSAVTLPQHFKRHGYATTAFGKIFHRPVLDDRLSWSISPWISGGPEWGSRENEARADSNWSRLRNGSWLASDPVSVGPPGDGTQLSKKMDELRSWQTRDVDDRALPDGRTARAAAAAIAALKNQRFLLAVGFVRPQLPLAAPKRYFDLYPAGSWAGPESPEPPLNAPSFALHGSEEVRVYADIPSEGPIPETKAKELIRAYRACVSFIDAQVGILLDALDEHGLTDSTVVAFVGVNGSHLGELGLWNKNSNYESATHAPLVVHAPGQRNAGRRTEALVESVDIFPSLCSLCHLPRPGGLEGSSWLGLFDDPKRLWKRAVYSQHPRSIPGVGPGMGYSMRTSRYRYTEWSGLNSPYSTAELYDYKDSPYELRNIANRPEHVSLVNGLAHMLREGWQNSLPPTELPFSSRA